MLFRSVGFTLTIERLAVAVRFTLAAVAAAAAALAVGFALTIERLAVAVGFTIAAITAATAALTVGFALAVERLAVAVGFAFAAVVTATAALAVGFTLTVEGLAVAAVAAATTALAIRFFVASFSWPAPIVPTVVSTAAVVSAALVAPRRFIFHKLSEATFTRSLWATPLAAWRIG